MKKLFSFYWGVRGGNVEGLFFATEQELEKIIGKEIIFGEILGKHSDVYGTLEKDEIQEIKLSQETLLELYNYFGETISGYNPLDYLSENEDEDED